jgi:3-oxoacyl-[acyl-carrier-protein] synthase III
MMISEPEAGAIYAARYLKDEMGKDFLKVASFACYFLTNVLQRRECFVLCDAGGGTVVSSVSLVRYSSAYSIGCCDISSHGAGTFGAEVGWGSYRSVNTCACPLLTI